MCQRKANTNGGDKALANKMTNKLEVWTTEREEQMLEKLVRRMRLDGKSDEEVKHFLETRATHYLRLRGYKSNGQDIYDYVGKQRGRFVKA